MCGIRDNIIQRGLLSESDLTLQRAIEICIGVELAEKNMLTLEEQSKMPEIHLMKKEEGRRKRRLPRIWKQMGQP